MHIINSSEQKQSLEQLLRFDPRLVSNGMIEVIVKYNGDLSEKVRQNGMTFELLNYDYAIVQGDIDGIVSLYDYPEVEYIELPKTLSYELTNALNSTCVTRVQNDPLALSGKGTLFGLIDSGIDYMHPDFRDENGNTRILYLWDQSSQFGTPPSGFNGGTEYTKDMIDEAISSDDPYSVVPEYDYIGHGTAVAGIAVGNGNSSGGREKGVAPEASVIAVKLGNNSFDSYARTTEIMRAFKYITSKAEELKMPLSINLSYGTNNGPHDGNSLFEKYIDDVSEQWKTVISVATGNDGRGGRHYSNTVKQNETLNIDFAAAQSTSKLYLSLWKNFADTFSFVLTSPDGERSNVITPMQRFSLFTLENSNITVIYGQPTNYSTSQEVYFLFDSGENYIKPGLWKLEVKGDSVLDGRFDIWMPNIETTQNDTFFSVPDPNVTLTLPSTSYNVISVGGYDSNTNSETAFSGRGYTRNNVYIKPDIAAPAVAILTTSPGGSYDVFSGTSLASPFVAGSACLILEWGIVRKNDIFLYGQRVKAFLTKGAKRIFNTSFPNNRWGYGTLCLSNTMELLEEYTRGGTVI